MSNLPTKKIFGSNTDQYKKRKYSFIYWYSILLTLFTCAFIWRVCFFPIDEVNLRFVDTILGFLMGSVFSNVVAFHFGSNDPNVKEVEKSDIKILNPNITTSEQEIVENIKKDLIENLNIKENKELKKDN